MTTQEFEALRKQAYEQMQKSMENATTDNQKRQILRNYNEYMRTLRSEYEWNL